MREKQLKPKENEFPHIGKLINSTLYQNRIKKRDVAKYLELNPIAMSYIVKRQSIQTESLWKICESTNHNFFGYLSEKINIPYETQTEKNLKLQIENLQQENREVKKENELLKELIKK